LFSPLACLRGARDDRGEHPRRGFLGTLAGAAVALAAGASASCGEPSPGSVGGMAKPRPKPTFPLGLASYTLRKFPLDKCLEMTRRVGLTHICLKSFHLALDATPEQIAKAAAQVKAAGLVLYAGGVISMGKEAEVNQAFEYAKAAGMKVIVAAPKPDVLRYVEKKVRQYDLRVAIHNHGPGDKVYPTPASVYEKVRDLDPRIGLCIDIGHTLRIGADPIESARKYADRLHDVHIKDVSAARPEGRTVEVGRGVIDIPEFLRTLVAIQYRGVVAFEHEKDENDPLAGLAESVGYVRGVLAVI
jgi:sugar phosphate isomerase/epimerase